MFRFFCNFAARKQNEMCVCVSFFPIFIHETAMQFPFIYVSAGERGLQLKVAPADLVKATRATVGVIARVPPEAPQD